MNKFIPISKPFIGEEELRLVTDAVSSGWVSSLGPYIEEFENLFANYCECKYALTTSNGTVGLHLALEALGIKAGDEVIVPDLTFVATANAVSYTGAKPVFVDIEANTLCIDPEKIEEAITCHTKAIVPVHLYGHPANMDLINHIAEKYNIIVIEDAAEALGSQFKSRPVGSLGLCGVFSFYGNKLITTGEGGMIVTNDLSLYLKAKDLRDHAMSKERRYWHDSIGFNYRMTNLQAALGVAQIKRIDYFLNARREIMDWYRQDFYGFPRVILNREEKWAKSSFWMICLEIFDIDIAGRDDLIRTLKENGVDSRPFFYPISDMPMYTKSNTPNSHKISSMGINLPIYIGLSRLDVKEISKKVISIINNIRG